MATGLFLAAAAVFLACVLLGPDAGSWVGYVRATAEASMVGALADWFAVTALFRHPLRLPIPHTAIIPRKKDQIGASLGTFVQENFLTRAVVEEKLITIDVPGRLGGFLAAPGRAERLADDASGRRSQPSSTASCTRPRRRRSWPASSSWSSRVTGTRRSSPRPCVCWRASSRRTGSCSGPSSATPPPRGCPTGWTTACSTVSSPV